MNTCVLDAEARSTLRKTRRKPKSKIESAEVAESAEKAAALFSRKLVNSGD